MNQASRLNVVFVNIKVLNFDEGIFDVYFLQKKKKNHKFNFIM